ncbi:F0F1 ATP synthase subunit B [Blastococcus sp. LR1]|jgi:F-type H+-transporting ATPase subunit b|uniref:F0F1 ATP synthase subunit B n=1 Tax=Blastococcus sp. LR1 TaxID=2877000 RepID=UPI001CC99EA2|nr:F0F1 ATP synthase subunit B [Blastococcus sp. LR1]MCA0146404.1 F0F1 ATP synthase subunit B [Blastococcus sp. LR1]
MGAIDNAAGVLAAEGGEGGFWESTYPVIPHPGELIVGIIAFAVLYFLYKRFVVPRLEAMLDERQRTIEGGIERAEAMQAEAKAALEQYKSQLAEARNEAAQIRDAARAEGQQIIEELRTQAQEESARIVARGEEQINSARQQVVNELRGQIGALAVDLAGRVVGESLADDARRQGTVDRFLDQLDGMNADGGRDAALTAPEGNR